MVIEEHKRKQCTTRHASLEIAKCASLLYSRSTVVKNRAKKGADEGVKRSS